MKKLFNNYIFTYMLKNHYKLSKDEINMKINDINNEIYNLNIYANQQNIYLLDLFGDAFVH